MGDHITRKILRAHLRDGRMGPGRQIGAGAERLTVKHVTKGTTFEARVALTRRERESILAGGRLAHTKAHPVR